jgi:hypothetical protein
MEMGRMKEQRDIEWLVNWAIEGQGVLHGSAKPLAPGWMTLGTRIDKSLNTSFSGGLVVDGAPHHDAVIIVRAIEGLPPEAASLLVRHGRLGYGQFARPDWCPEGVGSMQPVLKPNGEPKYDYEDSIKRRGEKRVRMSFVGHRQDWVTWCRAEYTLWWTSLAELVPIINLAMLGHEAMPPRAPARPWEAAGVVIHRAS